MEPTSWGNDIQCDNVKIKSSSMLITMRSSNTCAANFSMGSKDEYNECKFMNTTCVK